MTLQASDIQVDGANRAASGQEDSPGSKLPGDTGGAVSPYRGERARAAWQMGFDNRHPATTVAGPGFWQCWERGRADRAKTAPHGPAPLRSTRDGLAGQESGEAQAQDAEKAQET